MLTQKLAQKRASRLRSTMATSRSEERIGQTPRAQKGAIAVFLVLDTGIRTAEAEAWERTFPASDQAARCHVFRACRLPNPSGSIPGYSESQSQHQSKALAC
jgi:hypothetical protein